MSSRESRRRFAVITSQRTGSTLLVRSLDSAPGVFCAGELFHAGNRTLHREFQYPYLRGGGGLIAKLLDAILKSRRVREHLEMFYTHAGKDAQAVGFKLMVSQAAAFPAILPCLRKGGVSGIFLYRRNAFEAALSYFKATLSGRFHSDREGGPLDSRLVTANERDFGQTFGKCVKDRNQVLELYKEFGGYALAYEDMVSDWDGSIASVGSKIGLPELRVEKALSKLEEAGSVVVSNEEVLRGKFVDGRFRGATSPLADARRSHSSSPG